MAGRDFSAELFGPAPTPAAPEQGRDLSAELFGPAPTPAPKPVAAPAPQATGQVPYANRLQALDDAVNMLEENAPQQGVRDAYAKIGISWPDIIKHGQSRGSEYFKQQAVPAGIKPPAQPITGEITPAEKTYTEGVVNVGKRAKAGLREAIANPLFQAGALKPDQAARVLAQSARDRAAAAPSEDIQEGMMKIGSAETFGDAAYQLAANPRATFTMLVDSLAISLPMMAPAMALSPAGALTRSAISGTGSGGLEYGSAMADVLQEKKVNLLDPIAIEKALRDPKIMAEIKEVGAKRGLIIGVFDGVTAGLAGRFMRPARELIRAGQLTGPAARNATVSAWAKELGVQIAGGSGGEAAGQVATKGRIDKPADVLLEGLAEGISSPLEVRSALREAKELQAEQVPGIAPPAAPTTPTEPTIGKDFSAELFGERKEPVFREEGAPPPPPPPASSRDIEAEAARLNKMGIPMSEARRIAESVGRTPENALPPVDTWPDAAVRATLEFQLNKPEEDRNVELVNLLEAEVAKRGPVSEAQKRVADIADEFIAAGVPPLEARKRAEDQIKEQDEADALAEAEAAKVETPEQPSTKDIQTLLTNIANEFVTYAKLPPEEALERARGLIRDKYGADALAAAEATQGEQRDTETVVTPSGEGAGVAGVSDTGVPPGGPSETEPSGVVPTSEDAGQPPAGEATEPTTLEEAQTEEAPTEETVTAEAPKKRGRPALTEEQKAAKAATQQPKGKRGRKPLTEEQKAEKKKQNAPERATLAQIVRAVDKLTERIKNALTPVNEDAFETDEEVAQAEEDKRVERKDVIRELLKFDANPIVRGRPLHKRIKDLLNSPGITEQEKADIKKGMELVSKVNLREETLPAAGKAISEPVDSAYRSITSGLKALFHIIRTGTAAQKAIANRLRNSIGNIRFTVVEEGDTIPDQLRSPKNAEQWARSRALYIENYRTKARSIFVRGASFGESQGANNTTVLHELLHGATNYKIALAKEYIDKGIHLNSRLVKSFERLIEIMNFTGYKFNELETVDELPKEISALANYGDIFDDPREFVAYGMTDDRMQEFLKTTEGFDEDTYLFPTFVQNIRSFFGIKESEVNALSDLILAVHNLMEAPEEATPLEDTSTQVSAQAKRSAEEIDDAVKKAETTVAQSRAGEEARGVKLMQLARDPKQMLEIFPAMWEGAKNAQREVMVRLPTFDFLAKWMGKDVPMLNDMHKNLQNMTGMSTKFLEGAEQIISALQKTFNAEPDQRRKVEDLVLQTTLARIDPSIVAAQERSPTLDAAYRALSPAGKEAYKLLREYYERVHDLYRLLLDDQISNLEGISDEAKAKLMATIRLAYEGEESIRPFFPLVRRGNFWVATGSGPSRQFFMFESRRDRNKFAKQIRAVNASREVSVGDDVNTLRTASRDASNMLKELFDAIDKQDLTEPDVKEGLKDAVYQIYLQTMPEQTFRKMFVHRKGIAGFSTDLVRNTATTASKMATQLSRLKYAPILRNNLTAARSLLADRPEMTPIVREAQRRVESALSGREAGISDAIAGAANKLSYLWYLSSASSALIQPLSTIISGLPVLGANHGNVTGAAVEIGRMLTFINQYGITRRNLDGTLSYAAPSLANNEKLPDDEREAVRQMTERGVQDSTYSSLVWGYARTPNANLEGVVGKGKEAANLLIGGLMHHTERLSREALYLASYRLGTQRGLTNDEAVDQAVSDVNESLGDYSIENRPRWMQKGLGRIAFQFKMYPLQMTLLALTSFKRMMPFLNAEGKKEAATKFFGLMFTSAMLAGVSNMLLFSPIMGLLGWAWKQMGDDDDLPEDLKDKDPITWFQTIFLPENFGDMSIGGVSLADIIARGPINALTGADVGSRAGFHDLWGRDTKDMKTARESFTAFVIDNFGGPTASLGLSMIDAYEAYALGDYQKAIEKATPSVIRNIVIANKYATEGVESSRGSELIPKGALTKGELFGQAIGFRPDRVAAAQASAFKLMGIEQRVLNERATLLKRLNIEHRNAQKTDNYDRFDAIIADELPKFNGKNPENAIDSDDIYNSILKRAELRGSERAGVALTEKNARVMRDALDNLEKTLERK
jgi:Large polyvalent protein associated domain 39